MVGLVHSLEFCHSRIVYALCPPVPTLVLAATGSFRSNPSQASPSSSLPCTLSMHNLSVSVDFSSLLFILMRKTHKCNESLVTIVTYLCISLIRVLICVRPLLKCNSTVRAILGT
ncbi:hypothetical protein F4604DRAFT_1828923 [Suillus subluteus]|nr:hypothetical protein F4604DRAFT_1828923 [Suillus subluteus]